MGAGNPVQDGSMHRGDRDSPEETLWDELLLWQEVSRAPGAQGAEAVQVSEHRLRSLRASVLQGMAGHGSLGSWPCGDRLLLWRHSRDWDCGATGERGLPEWCAQPVLSWRLAACSWP